MRCIDKGTAPATYTYYKHARNDLAKRIGWICCYCEMPVNNMIEVEHVHPVANGGDALSWDNFLLSCRYCNGVKSNRNPGRNGYLWPDADNTVIAFSYSENNIIEPSTELPGPIYEMANKTIELLGLDRRPGNKNEPTNADLRWIRRTEIWGIIDESYNDWLNNKTLAFARQIAKTAVASGFYSYWIKKFREENIVLNEMHREFPNTYLPQYNAQGDLMLRANGSF